MALGPHVDKVSIATASLARLESSEKKLENQLDDATKAIVKAEEEGKPVEEINKLKDVKDKTETAIWITKLAAEDISDGRDEIMKKDLRLQDKRGQIVILGLDHAGKTTLLRTLKDNDPLAQLVSTLYENSEELIIRNIKFLAFDLSGRHAQAGREWKNHLPAVDSIVFLINATDQNRFALAKAELDSLLSDEQVASVPIAILGTKSDLEEAIDEEELRETLGLVSATEESTSDRSDKDSGRQIQLFTCDVREQRTFGQAFRWLRHYLKDI